MLIVTVSVSTSVMVSKPGLGAPDAGPPVTDATSTNVVAVVRPPEAHREGDLERAPLARSIAFAVVGLVAALWAVGSLLT